MEVKAEVGVVFESRVTEWRYKLIEIFLSLESKLDVECSGPGVEPIDLALNLLDLGGCSLLLHRSSKHFNAL